MVSGVRDGTPMTEEECARFVRRVSGDQWILTVQGPEGISTSKSRVTLGASKNHKEVDVVRPDGPAAGKPTRGIYEFEGDRLRVCLAQPDQPRPTELAAAAGSGHTLTVWERTEAAGASTALTVAQREAAERLDAVSKTTADVSAWRYESLIRAIPQPGEAASPPTVVTVAFQSPNLFVQRANDSSALEVSCDGRRLVILDPRSGEFTDAPAPADRAALARGLASIAIARLSLAAPYLVAPAIAESLVEKEPPTIVGLERHGDIPWTMVRIQRDSSHVLLGISAAGDTGGTRPTIAAVRVVRFEDGVRSGLSEIVSNWQTGDAARTTDFTVRLPAGARRVERLGSGE
jgi:uncharacterized protein (TIGR03067 family)